ncbi:MAG: tetratricopeptide repeat protein, partial [Bacteroidales bacterium]|nr:tetratricopeptide repeat protein [Bacteroidales bacterium]
IGLLLCILCVPRLWKKYDRVVLLLLLFSVVFPIVYVVKTNANIYEGWRHLTFIYPAIGIFVGMGYYEISTLFRKNWEKICYACIVASIFSPSVIWMCKNYKYSFSFYNKLIDPYTNYDIDLSETACVCAFKWLMSNELADNKDSVMISTHNENVEHYQKLKQIHNIHLETVGVRGFSDIDCDYSIVHIVFLPKKVMRNFFPPQGTIHVETHNGKPICAVVKRNKLDIHGVQEIRKGNYAEGLSLLDSAYRYDPNNFTIWWWMGLGYYSTGDYQKAIQFFDQVLNFWPSPYQVISGTIYKGASFFYLNRYSEAIQTLATVERNCEEDKPFVFAFMGMSHYHNKDYAKAIPYLQYAVQYYPSLNSMLADCRNR